MIDLMGKIRAHLLSYTKFLLFLTFIINSAATEILKLKMVESA